jgi:hypothetical protein
VPDPRSQYSKTGPRITRVRPRYVFLKDLKFSRFYCMLKAYFDESYDHATMCVGGWICDENSWKQIESKWLARIEHERRMSVKNGFTPISRYHATDCANLKREFREENGWNIARQICLTKRLIDIIGSADPKPIGIAIGISLTELRAFKPDLTDKEAKEHAYSFCISECLDNVRHVMRARLTDERVSVFYEQSKQFGYLAGEAFQRGQDRRLPGANQIITVAPGRWQDFPAFQPADMIAYEGFRLTASIKRGNVKLRKSLEQVIGHDVFVRAGIINCK